MCLFKVENYMSFNFNFEVFQADYVIVVDVIVGRFMQKIPADFPVSHIILPASGFSSVF